MQKLKILFAKYHKHLYLLAAVVVFGFGALIAIIGNSQRNPLVIVIGFGGLSGGVMLFRAWMGVGQLHFEKEPVAILGDKPNEGEVAKPPNSLIITPSQVGFAYVAMPVGQAQKCYNDGKYYHVIKASENMQNFEEFALPDDDEKERYYDPAEFANPVTMPSNKKYFTWSSTLMQKISLGIMTVVIIGEVIGLIAIGG